jgi:isopentenyldiphosphate isomerase
MDELIDILTPQGEFTGQHCLKSVAHQKGLYHATVHIWFYTRHGMLLLQKRGRNKKTYPNHWDVSVAGHVHAGETIEDAAIREVEEEIGLIIQKKDLQKIAVRKGERSHPNGIQDNEFYHVFVCELTTKLSNLSKQDEEVEALELFDLKILEGTNEEIPLVPNTFDYYQFILSEVEAIID